MKKYVLIFIIIFSIVSICHGEELDYVANDIEKIEIGIFQSAGIEVRTVLIKKDEINDFLDSFLFNKKRKLTVKHPLLGRIVIYFNNGNVEYSSFEGKMFRYNNAEYSLDNKTVKMLKGFSLSAMVDTQSIKNYVGEYSLDLERMNIGTEPKTYCML